MQERFDTELKEGCIVELDSSTPAKFSRHVIVRIPGAAFLSNFHVGAFVKELCEPPGSADSPYSPGQVARQEFLIHKVRPPWMYVSRIGVSPLFFTRAHASWDTGVNPLAVYFPCVFKDGVPA